MILKKIFDSTFLSMPYYGGLSSLAIVLMVSAYLNKFDVDRENSLSRNLCNFFHFYGCGFQPHKLFLDGNVIKSINDLDTP